jgi:hypothetical protein
MIGRLIAVALVVAVVAALLPGAAGLYLKQRWDALLDDVAARGYALAARDYRQGWLQSEAQVEIAPPADADDAAPKLGLVLNVEHGYALWFAQWPPRLAAFRGRASVLGGPRPLPPLRLAGTLGVGGAVSGTLRVPDVTYSGAVGQLHFVAGSGDFAVGPDGRWALSGGLDALEAEAPDARKLRLTGLGVSLVLARADPAWPVGELGLTLDGLTLDASTTVSAMTLGGLDVALATERDGAAAAVRTGGTVAMLAIGGAGYAPSGIELSLTGLQVPAVAALRARLAALGPKALTPSQRGAAVAQTVLAGLPALVGDDAGLRLSALRVTTPSGELAAEVDLRLAPPAAGAAAERPGGVAADPLRAFVGRLAGTAEVSGPQALVVALLAREQTRRVREELALRGESSATLPPALAAELEAAAQASAQALLREGWLVAEQGRLVARLQLDGGMLTVNQKPVAVAGWLAPAATPGAQPAPSAP